MGQKVNPVSLRLEKTNRHFDSCWYDDYYYTDLLLQDLKIKNHLKAVLDQIQYPEGRVLIENLPKKTNINLFYYNPTNSRRKRNTRFQLQDFKENKSKELYKNKNTIRFQPGIEKKEEWKNSLTTLDYRFFGKDFNESTSRNVLALCARDEKSNNFQASQTGLHFFNHDASLRKATRPARDFSWNPRRRRAHFSKTRQERKKNNTIP